MESRRGAELNARELRTLVELWWQMVLAYHGAIAYEDDDEAPKAAPIDNGKKWHMLLRPVNQ